MASTPEGKVKKLINSLLTEYKPDMYWNNPVPAGYGTPMLDTVGCYRGYFFAIEAKAAGKKPTPRQELCIEQMRAAGGTVFVVDGPEALEKVKDWLDGIGNGTGEHGSQELGNTE